MTQPGGILQGLALPLTSPIPSTPSSPRHTPLPSSPVKLPEWSSISPFLAFAHAFPTAPPLLSYPNQCGPLDLRSCFSGDPPLTIQLALVHSTCHTVHPSIITYTSLGLVVGFHVVSHQTQFLEVGGSVSAIYAVGYGSPRE